MNGTLRQRYLYQRYEIQLYDQRFTLQQAKTGLYHFYFRLATVCLSPLHSASLLSSPLHLDNYTDPSKFFASGEHYISNILTHLFQAPCTCQFVFLGSVNIIFSRSINLFNDLATNATRKGIKIVLYSGNDDALIPHFGTEST
jgi:hypothetical protein